uniref:ATP phosphoribosyltransferase n=1 Tax=Quercus lobata TaxID=97700 RepID=A0A7N2L1Y5_QUELO
MSVMLQPCLSASMPSFPFKRTVLVCCASSQQSDARVPERTKVRLGLPSKGCMESDTLRLLEACQLPVNREKPRQYVGQIPELADLEVWFQRPKDIVRRLISGDIDLGIVGFDIVSEYGQGNEDLIIVHDALKYGECRLSLAIPKYGIFENINSLKDLAQMTQWTAENPLRVATGFTYLGPKFMKENGLKYVTFSTADGALEAAPARGRQSPTEESILLASPMGVADAIVDLVSSGTTLKENDLKEIKGGIVLKSQAVLVASRKALMQREGALDITRKILKRLEKRLETVGQFRVSANMRGSSAEEVAERILSQPSLSGLQVVGNGVLVSLLTNIFNEETPRWYKLLKKLGL